jgi:transcription antitermination protein NusB
LATRWTKKLKAAMTETQPKETQHKAPPKSARRRAREFALQGLYHWLLNAEDVGVIDAHMRGVTGFDRADTAHFDAVLHGAIEHSAALREHFAPHLDRTLAELSPIEHAILLLGSYELEHHLDVPMRVVINEAVDLAKDYGGTDGYKFVNGVLDKVAAVARAAEFARR